MVEEEPVTPHKGIRGDKDQEWIDLDTPPRPTPVAKKKKKVVLQVNYVSEGVIKASRKLAHVPMWKKMALSDFEKQNIILGVQVREAEEVQDSNTNWLAHFARKFHEHLTLSKSIKRTQTGSHIRVILSVLGIDGITPTGAPLGFPTVIVSTPSGTPGVMPTKVASATPEEGESQPTPGQQKWRLPLLMIKSSS
ncbi:unnamed protein product [Calypogeia fissa]